MTSPLQQEAVSAVTGGVRLRVHAQPGAKKTEVSGFHGDAVKIRIQSPPVDGKANDELIRFLADKLDLARSKISLLSGQTSRAKTFVIQERSVDQLKSALGLR